MRDWPMEAWIAIGILLLTLHDLLMVGAHLGLWSLPR